MKKLLVFTFCLFNIYFINAQALKLGAKVGLGSSSVKAEDLLIRNGNDLNDLKLNFQSSSPAVQGGLFARVSLLGIYVQPELLLTFANASYLAEDAGGTSQGIYNERLVYLDMPVTAGFKLAFLRVYGGPVFTSLIGSQSDLSDIDGVSRNSKQSTVAGQIGTGLDIGKITLDLKYEFNLSGKRDQVSFFGNDYNLSKRRSQAIASIGYVF